MEELNSEMEAALEENDISLDTKLEDNLAKMQSILANMTAQRRRLGIAIKKAQVRHSNAKVDILVRRFAHDLKLLKEQYEDVVGKEAWAKRLISSLQHGIELHKNTNEGGFLVQRPFQALGALLK
jgi:hypothetical protein